jgi:hypothetical protein
MTNIIAKDESGNQGLTGVNSVYRFRAECLPDVDELMRLLGAKFKKITIVISPPFPDVKAELEIGLDLTELRNVMRRVVDGHVMVQTVARTEEYTGERDYDL